MRQQFNLELYKAHPDWKVKTRDGKPARIICMDRKSNNNYPIVALINDGEREFPNTYNPAGRCRINNFDDDLDLFLVTPEPELPDGLTVGGYLDLRDTGITDTSKVRRQLAAEQKKRISRAEYGSKTFEKFFTKE